MRKNKTPIEWIVIEDETEWQNAVPPPSGEKRLAAPSNEVKGQRVRWKLWATAFALLCTMGIAIWRTSQAGLHQLEQEVGEAAEIEVGALLMRESVGYDMGYLEVIRSDAVENPPTLKTELLEIHSDVAAVRTLLYAEGGEALRQVRFYRRTESGWHPMPPDASLWGTAQRFESDYFVFHYQSMDKDAVAGAALRLDELYATLHAHLGLPQPEAKQIIAVSALLDPGSTDHRQEDDRFWRTASPARYLAPLELSESDLLVQAVALDVLDEAIEQAKAHYGQQWQWQPVYDGIYLWELWALDLPLAAWGDEIRQWYYGERPLGAEIVPEHFSEMCTAHSLWVESLTDVHLPFMCTESNRYVACCYSFAATTETDFGTLTCQPRHFWQLTRDVSSWGFCTDTGIGIATVVEYAVETYGVETLPELLAGLGYYETWKELVPGVYGVSPDEFERGWQVYVAGHYQSHE